LNVSTVRKALAVSIITMMALPIVQASKTQNIEELFDLAAEYSRYDRTERRPEIVSRSDAAIRQEINNTKHLLVCGYYDHHSNTLIFSRSSKFIDPIHSKACKIHEIVHFLQDINGKDFSSCFKRKRLEAEAYFVQNRYLSKNDGQIINWTTQHHRWCKR